MPNTELNNPAVSWRDYLELCKPNVVALMILTSVIGMLLATDQSIPLSVFIFGNLGIALVAGSAAAVNHIVDRHVDDKMARTLNRPLVQGRLKPQQATIFALVTGIFGMAFLLIFTNVLTAWLTLAALVGYAFVYTMFLKRATPQNIVIGGIFGAAPPLFGWTAVTNSIDPGGLLLVLIIFAWTPPHFWALAIDRMEDYKKADIPMLPVTHGEAYTKLHILLYTIIMIIVSILPFLIGMSNILYFISALALGAGFLYWSLVLYKGNNRKAPMETFRYSILYLGLLFLALLLDHYILPAEHLTLI